MVIISSSTSGASQPGADAEAMREYVRSVWRVYSDALADPRHPLVRPSVPIAWFGDLDAYARSPVRIMTVGLNPSRSEFPACDPFLRFRRAEPLAQRSELSEADVDLYVGAISRYFADHPYRRWFDGSYREVLKGIGATFYPSALSRVTAIHSDLMSTLATDPTWTGLSRARQLNLARDGVALWHRLTEVVKPQVVVASLAERHLAAIFPGIDGWQEVYAVWKKKKWTVRAAQLSIGRSVSILVHAPAQTLPFGPFTTAEKLELGSNLSKLLRASGEPAP
jgi:hypothetical protein